MIDEAFLRFCSKRNAHPDDLPPCHNINCRRPDGMNALHLCIQNNNLRLFKHLLACGADPDSAILQTALHDKIDFLETLMEHGARVDTVDTHHFPISWYIGLGGAIQIYRFLRRLGSSDINKEIIRSMAFLSQHTHPGKHHELLRCITPRNESA
jgi:ankyrin repeat protein